MGRVLTVLGVAVLAILVLWRMSGGRNEPITAAVLAEAANKQRTFPIDLGDGFRLDSISASGNAVVSVVTLIEEPAGPVDEALKEVLRTATVSDICREIASAKQAYIDTGITLVKTYRNSAGGEMVSVEVAPGDCP